MHYEQKIQSFSYLLHMLNEYQLDYHKIYIPSEERRKRYYELSKIV